MHNLIEWSIGNCFLSVISYYPAMGSYEPILPSSSSKSGITLRVLGRLSNAKLIIAQKEQMPSAVVTIFSSEIALCP